MYDHYIGIDWAISNMAIARLTKNGDKPHVINVPSDVDEIKIYLKNLRGKKILTFEETTGSQWLYVELRQYVDELIICDPYRNALLSEGPKNDEIDAVKLATLLKAGLLKPVYHSNDKFIQIRKLMSAYEDFIQRGVRIKNQRSALNRSIGNEEINVKDYPIESFISKIQEENLDLYKEEYKEFHQLFEKFVKESMLLKKLMQIPGIGLVNAMTIAAYVVDVKRFQHKNKFLAYTGLVKYRRDSGGKNYGTKKTRYHRKLKSVFKSGALSAIKGNNSLKKTYHYLMEKKGYPEHQARHAISRLLAIAVFGVMNTGKNFDANKIGIINRALS